MNPYGKRIGVSCHPFDVATGRKSLDTSLFLEIVHSGVLIRKAIFDEIGGYDRTARPVEDRHLWGRLITAGYGISCQEKYLIEYRLHGKSVTVGKDRGSAADIIDLNVIRRLQGRPKMTPDEYEAWAGALPWWTKVSCRRESAAIMIYKSATRDYAEGRLIAFILRLGTAAVLRPRWVCKRLYGKAMAARAYRPARPNCV